VIDRTGRIKRGPGEPARFMYKDRPLPAKSLLRAAWIKEQTGYDVDPRSIFISEALRAPYYRERPAEHKAADKGSRASTYVTSASLVQEMRTSERNTFSTCHYQWWWRYVEKLTPKRPATALWFGSAVHVALAQFYLPGLARGPHPAETFDNVLIGDRKTWTTENTTDEEELTWSDARELGVDMLNNYIRTYGQDPQYYVLAVEETFALEFKRNGRTFLKYLLTMDGLVRDMENGQIRILEHKTARDWGIIKKLRLDNQAGSYYAAAPHVLPLADLLKPGERISGIDYNILRKAKFDDRPQNADGARTNKPQKAHYIAAIAEHSEYAAERLQKAKIEELEAIAKTYDLTVLGEVSAKQPDKYFRREPVYRTPEEQTTQLQRIQDEALYMEGMRSGDPAYPILKTPGDHCSWCPFKQMCELHEAGDDDAVESFKSAVMVIEDPYLAYRGKAA